jgi:hypothetical protein
MTFILSYHSSAASVKQLQNKPKAKPSYYKQQPLTLKRLVPGRAVLEPWLLMVNNILLDAYKD